MEFPEVMAQMTYWDRFPPIHLLFRTFVGYELDGDRKDDEDGGERQRLRGPEFVEIGLVAGVADVDQE